MPTQPLLLNTALAAAAAPLESRDDILRWLSLITEIRRTALADCGRLPSKKLHDPVITGTWSVLQILLHLSQREESIVAGVRGKSGEPDIEAEEDLDDVAIALDESHAAAVAAIKMHSSDGVSRLCKVGDQYMSVGAAYSKLIAHEFHHQAFVSFKLGRLLRQ